MPDELKITFQLTARDDERLEVRVDAPGGQARGETPLPDGALLDQVGGQDPAHLPTALVDKTGQALYAALVNEGVDEVVVGTLNDAMRLGRQVQFELRFDPDQVALTRWPWEMIQNAQGQFVVRDGLVDLTRYITYPQPPPVFDQSMRGLPLFHVISDPTALPPLMTAPLGFQPVETLEHATFEAFMRRLLIDRLSLWGLQFDGHGALVLQCAACDTLNDPSVSICRKCGRSLADAKRIGALAFEQEGGVNWVPTAEFGSVLYNARVRLAVLLACETAAVGGKVVFSGLAPGLLLAGVPAVIGMQYPVLDTFANSFANEFYAALGRTGDLLGAVRVARRINMQGAWYSPALYLRRQPGAEEQASGSIYLTRSIDTAAPAKVKAGAAFLVRLWIRRPETRPLSAAKLRDELDIPRDVPVRQRKGEAEVRFEPTLGRRLRRGEVEVRLSSTGADVTPDRMKLFIDETLDAPPAIFTVRAVALGNIPLVFTVLQDGGVIHTVTHTVEATVGEQLAAEVAEHSQAVDMADEFKKSGTSPLPPVDLVDAFKKPATGSFSAASRETPPPPRPGDSGSTPPFLRRDRTPSTPLPRVTLEEAEAAARNEDRTEQQTKDSEKTAAPGGPVKQREADPRLSHAMPPPPPPVSAPAPAPAQMQPPPPQEIDAFGDTLLNEDTPVVPHVPGADTFDLDETRRSQRYGQAQELDEDGTPPRLPPVGAPQAAAPIARPVPASEVDARYGRIRQEPAMAAPQVSRAAKKSGFPIWLVIGVLLGLLCLAAVAMIILGGALGK